MNDELFREIVESVREGGAILRSRSEPARTIVIDEADEAAVRVARPQPDAGADTVTS